MSTLAAPLPKSLWLVNRTYDIGWFVATCLVPFAVFLPVYYAFGSASVLPLYLVASFVFGNPHNYMTWALTLSPTGRKFYKPGALSRPLLLTLALTALLALSLFAAGPAFGIRGYDAIMTIYVLIAYWHVYRQHLGMLKIYGGKYGKAVGDSSHVEDFKPLFRAFHLTVFYPFLLLWMRPEIHLGMGKNAYQLLHPVLPWPVMAVYALVMVICFIQAALMLARRARTGLPLPTAHLGLFVAVLISYWGAFSLVRPEDMLLAVAILTVFHNLQYWGFTWYFQRSRAECELAETVELDRLHRWANEGKFVRYVGMAFLFSLALLGGSLLMPPALVLMMAFFNGTSHHLVDAFVWSRKYNPRMGAHLKV